MRGKVIRMICALSVLAASASAHATHYVGGDISLLPKYEVAGAQYKDYEGSRIDSLLPWLHEQGMNAMRVRLFVDPDGYAGSGKDPNACQSLDYIIPLCRNIVNNGMSLMLDFHYSDTWADPAAQYTPAAWGNLSDEQLYDKIYEYTRSTLLTLKAEGVVPAFIQPGNEISYGMLWGKEGSPESQLKKTFMGSDANWARLGHLLNNAIRACREVCPQAQIVIHTERVGQTDVQQNFYDKMNSLAVDYDIIGLSYYPYFHGDMNVLDTALTLLESRYPRKRIMIVETGYTYKWEVPGTTVNLSDKYPYSEEGQDRFAHDLVDTLERHSTVDGLFWWWMEYNAFGTNLSGWYNAPLFNSMNGCATPALKTICSFADSDAVTEITDRNKATLWYDMTGNRVSAPAHGIYVRRNACGSAKVLIP